jgi:dCTP diphosphatase
MEPYEKEIRDYLVERGWDNLRPGDLAKSISIEAAELLEIFQWSNETLEDVKNDPEKTEKIKKELADVLI